MSLQELVDALPLAACLVSPDGTIIHYNRPAVDLWGREPTPATAKWCGAWRLFWPDGRSMALEDHPAAVAMRERRTIHGIEAIAERPDGTRVWFLAYPTPLLDESLAPTGVLNVLVDISARKRIQVADQQLAAIVESSYDAIVGKDLNGTIVTWNAGAERLFGYPADEAIGRHISIVIPDDRADEETHIISRIRRGERVETYETVRQRRDGSLVDVALTVSPVRDSEGRIIGASKIARDITGQRRDAERQRLLVGEMRHRIKNSLATVQAIARQTLTSASQEEMRAFSGRLQALAGAHDILTVENWNKASLAEIVGQAIDIFDDIEKERFIVQGEPGVWLEAERAARLAMILHELATNAIKYGALSNDTGRVTISWETSLTANGRKLRLSWLERGGPEVVKPRHEGFGSTLIARSFQDDDSSGDLVYDSSGVRATFDLKL
jgi:two-component system, chemotaxis family, CheB/CheR fusion protein